MTTTAATTTVIVSGASAGVTAAADLQGLVMLGFMDCSSPFVKGVAESGKRAVVPFEVGSTQIGGLLGCLIVLVGGAILHFIAGAIYYRLFPDDTGGRGLAVALSHVKFPSKTMSLSGVLFQGVAFEMIRIVAVVPDATIAEKVVAIVVYGIFIAQPIVLGIWCLKKGGDASFVTYSRRGCWGVGPLGKLSPTGFWICDKARTRMMFGGFTGYLKKNYAIFNLLPAIRATLIAVVVLLGDFTGSCEAQSGVLAGVFAVTLIPLLVLRPFVIQFQILISTAMTALTITVVMMSTSAELGEQAALVMTASTFVSIGGVVVMSILQFVAWRWKKVQMEAMREVGMGLGEDLENTGKSPQGISKRDDGGSAPNTSALLVPPSYDAPDDSRNELSNPLLQSYEMRTR